MKISSKVYMIAFTSPTGNEMQLREGITHVKVVTPLAEVISGLVIKIYNNYLVIGGKIVTYEMIDEIFYIEPPEEGGESNVKADENGGPT
jgi:hypothetical protein